MLYKVNILITW